MNLSDRIIAGQWKGRPLLLAKDAGVRPSKNRVRQAVFNMLGSRLDWDGLTVADLCCGSGAWGLEAASRNAAHVFLVDRDVAVAAKNTQTLAATAVQVVKGDAAAWTPPALLDVVLADPPYDSTLAQALIRHANRLGKDGSWWAMETAATTELDWAGFDGVVFRDYGGSRVWVARQALGERP